MSKKDAYFKRDPRWDGTANKTTGYMEALNFHVQQRYPQFYPGLHIPAPQQQLDKDGVLFVAEPAISFPVTEVAYVKAAIAATAQMKAATYMAYSPEQRLNNFPYNYYVALQKLNTACQSNTQKKLSIMQIPNQTYGTMDYKVALNTVDQIHTPPPLAAQ